MPLNMNTVGTGSGFDGGSSCTEVLFDMSYELSSKVKMTNITSISPNGSKYSKTGDEHYYTESISTCADAVDGATIFARYNNELYGSLSRGGQTFCKIQINDDLDVSKITCTYTKITAPFVHFCEALIVGKYMYIVGNACASTSVSTRDYANDKIYRFDGNSFTEIPTTDFSAGSVSYGLHMHRIPKSSDNSTYVLITSLYAGSPENPYFGVLKLNQDGELEKVFGFNDSKNSDYQYHYLYPTNVRSCAERFHLDLGSGYNTAFPLSIELSDSAINIYFGHIYREEGSSFTVTQYKCVYMITFDLRSTPYPMSFTTVSSYDEISHISFTSTTAPSYYDGIFIARVYPLDHLLYDSYLMFINNGYGGDSGTASLLNYVITTDSKDMSIKSISGGLTSQNTIGSIWYAAINGLYIDLDSEYPAYHYTIYSTRDDDNYYRFTRYMQHIAVTGSQDSSGTTCTFSTYCQKGDTCICNAGIISYIFDKASVDVNGTKLNITTDGYYIFTTHTYDAYHAPEFIIKSKSGSILGTRCTYNKNTLTGYFSSGMTINDTKITKNGYNEITIDKPRISIKI